MQATASNLTNAYNVPVLLSSLCEEPGVAKETEREPAYIQADGNCFRGILLGFCLEASVGLCVFGMWQVWHILQ